MIQEGLAPGVFSTACDSLKGVAITSMTGHECSPAINISNTLPSLLTPYMLSMQLKIKGQIQ